MWPSPRSSQPATTSRSPLGAQARPLRKKRSASSPETRTRSSPVGVEQVRLGDPASLATGVGQQVLHRRPVQWHRELPTRSPQGHELPFGGEDYRDPREIGAPAGWPAPPCTGPRGLPGVLSGGEMSDSRWVLVCRFARSAGVRSKGPLTRAFALVARAGFEPATSGSMSPAVLGSAQAYPLLTGVVRSCEITSDHLSQPQFSHKNPPPMLLTKQALRTVPSHPYSAAGSAVLVQPRDLTVSKLGDGHPDLVATNSPSVMT
jgi:hypothetical protein